MTDERIKVEVAYATPERQWLIALEVPRGTTAGEAIRLSGILDEHPALDTSSMGVFAEHVNPDYRLETGDRVEIYRPLAADPKDVRRERARQGKENNRR